MIIYIIIILIICIIIIYFKNEYFKQEYFDNALTMDIIYEHLNNLNRQNNIQDIQKEIISDYPGSSLKYKLLEGILLVDNTLQHYLVVSRGLLQIYKINIIDNKINIEQKITFNPQSNTYWNFHYREKLSKYLNTINIFDWRFQNDGNLVLYDYEGLPFWQSNTFIDKYILSIDQFNIVLTKYNNSKEKKIININQNDSIKIPSEDKFEDITSSDYIFEYYINKINKIYNNEKLPTHIVTSPMIPRSTEFKTHMCVK